MIEPADILFDLQEVAAVLRVSPSTVKRLRKAGRLRGLKVSARLVRYRQTDVQAYLENLQEGSEQCPVQATK